MNLQSLFCGILLFLSVTALIISCLAFSRVDGGGEYYSQESALVPQPGPTPGPTPKPCKGTCAPLGPFGAAAYCDHKTKKCEYCNKEGICEYEGLETCTASDQKCKPVRGYGPQTCNLTEPCLACKNSDWCSTCDEGDEGADTCPIELPAASNWSPNSFPNSSPNSGGDLVITRRLCVGNNTAYCPRPGAQKTDGCGNQQSIGRACPNNVGCPPDRSGHYPDTRFTPCERCNHGQCIRCKPKFKFKSYPDGTTKCECTPSSCPWNYSCRMEKPYNGTCQPRGCKFNVDCAGAPSSWCCPDNHGKMHACCQ